MRRFTLFEIAYQLEARARVGRALARASGWYAIAVLAICGAAPAAPPAPAKMNAVQPLPDKPPAWLDGYRVRWPLRVAGDPTKQPAQSVLVSIPTGGWLKPDASDLAVQAAT